MYDWQGCSPACLSSLPVNQLRLYHTSYSENLSPCTWGCVWHVSVSSPDPSGCGTGLWGLWLYVVGLLSPPYPDPFYSTCYSSSLSEFIFQIKALSSLLHYVDQETGSHDCCCHPGLCQYHPCSTPNIRWVPTNPVKVKSVLSCVLKKQGYLEQDKRSLLVFVFVFKQRMKKRKKKPTYKGKPQGILVSHSRSPNKIF